MRHVIIAASLLQGGGEGEGREWHTKQLQTMSDYAWHKTSLANGYML